MDLSGYQDGLEGLSPIEQPQTEAAAPTATEQPQAPQMSEKLAQGLKDATGEADNPIGGFLEDAAVGVIDFFDQSRDADEVREDRQEIRKDAQQDTARKQDKLDQEAGLAPELIRATVGGVAGAVEQTGEFGELVGDTAKTALGVAEEEDNVFGDKYEHAQWNLGVSENKTAVGGFARTMTTFAIGMRQMGRIPGLSTLGQGSRLGRIGQGLAQGGLTDLVLIDTEEGGMGNAIGEMFPGVKDTPILGALVGAITVEDGEGPWTAKLKGVLEGGITGTAIDGTMEAVGLLRAGFRAKAKAKAAGRSAEIAKKEAIEAMNAQLQLDLDPLNDAPRQMTLDDAGLDMTPYQAKQVRQTQDTVYGSSPNRTGLYEVDSKSTRIDISEPQKVAEAHAALDGMEGNLNGRSAPTLLTDAATNKIASVGVTDVEQVVIRDTIKRVGSNIDVDALSKKMGQSNKETYTKALSAVEQFIGAPQSISPDEAMKSLDDVMFIDGDGNKILKREGVVATKMMISDFALQLNDIAGNAIDLMQSGVRVPVAQAEMITGRMKGLLRAHKEAAVHYASGLQSFKLGPIEFGPNKVKLAKELDSIDKGFDDLLSKVKKGDEASLAEFRSLTQGLVLADGDPLKQLTFGALARRIGGRAALTTMYNSLLSGPITHARNLTGNLFTTVLRPTSMAVGYMMDGDLDAAKASIASMGAISEAWGEAFSVAGKTWNTGIPSNGSAKFEKYTAETLKEIETMKKSAITPSQKQAAEYIENLYNFTNNPFMDAPSRALGASDDFFKTLNARVELKRQAYMETLQATGEVKFDPDVYARIADAKMRNGEITDEGLLKVTKEATFQQELEGTMKTVSNLIDSNPLAKYFIPFVRTGHNIAVYAGTFTPGLNRFLKEAQAIRSGSDDAAKAMLKGRVAIGYGTLAMGSMMAANGLLTGNGPADPELRKIWLRNNQPQSIKLGDTWVSYQSIEPLNQMFSVSADLFEAAAFLPERDFNRLQAQLYYTFAKAFTEKSYFSGLHSAIAYLNPGTAGNVNIPREMYGAINSFIPFAGARNQLGKAIAPGMYEFNTEFESAMARALPGYKNFAQEDIDIFTGEPKQNNTSAGPVFHVINQFFPFSVTKDPNDPVINMLSELNVSTTTDHGETLMGVDLTQKQRGRINKLIADAGLHKELKSLMNKPWFKADVQRWKDSLGTGQPTDRKQTRWYAEVTGKFTAARTAATAAFAAEDAEFREQLKQAKRNRYYQKSGQYDQVKDFYKQ